MDLRLVAGIPPEYREQAARVHHAAFREKYREILGDDDRAVEFWRRVFNDDGCTLAVDEGADDVLGVMVTTDAQVPVAVGEWAAAREVYGAVRGSWRGLLLRLARDQAGPNELLIAFLSVSPQARGRGVGGVLLTFAEQLARVRGRDRLTLEVVDTNPRAKALYERSGFQTYATRRLPPGLRRYMGFSAYDKMVRPVPAQG